MRTDRIGRLHARTLFALTVTLLLLTPAVRAVAGDERGSISGAVRDNAGNGVVGLSIRLVQRDGQGQSRKVKIIARATTDGQGRFRMEQVPPGGYHIEAGSKSVGWIFQEVEIEAGKELKLDDLRLAQAGR